MKKLKLSIIASCFSLLGLRLDTALAKLYKEYSRSYLKKLILMNCVLVDKNIVNHPDKKIFGGELITIYPQNKNCVVETPENIALDIVYEDCSILIINKPAGIVVHPGSGNNTGTILNALLYRYKSSKDLPRAGIVHRLDKDTTGLMVVAKTFFSYTYLTDLLKKRKITRKYQAFVKGDIISGGTINEPIKRHILKKNRMMVHYLGKKSITHYTIIKRFKFFTHIEVQLDTGRTHQIRVHMLHIKYPLIGDPLYKGINRKSQYEKNINLKKIYDFPRQALHAYQLSFLHPIDNNLMSWSIPLPQDMQNLLVFFQKN